MSKIILMIALIVVGFETIQAQEKIPTRSSLFKEGVTYSMRDVFQLQYHVIKRINSVEYEVRSTLPATQYALSMSDRAVLIVKSVVLFPGQLRNDIQLKYLGRFALPTQDGYNHAYDIWEEMTKDPWSNIPWEKEKKPAKKGKTK